MTICSVHKVEISFLVAEPLTLHDTIVCRIIIESLISQHNPAIHLYTICRKIIADPVYDALASCNTTVSRCQIIGSGLISKPSSHQISCSIQIVSGIIIVNPASLHTPVPVKTCISVVINKTFRNDQVAVILVLVIHIHTASESAHVAIAGILPEAYIIIVITAVIVLGYPFIPSADAELTCKHIFIGIHHGIIAGCINLCTECINNINELLIAQISLTLIFDIKNNGIVYCIIADPLKYEISFLGCRLRSCCVGVNINSGFQSCRLGICYIGSKVGINTALGASHLDKRKFHTGSCYLAPVDGSIVLGHIHALCNGTVCVHGRYIRNLKRPHGYHCKQNSHKSLSHCFDPFPHSSLSLSCFRIFSKFTTG